MGMKEHRPGMFLSRMFRETLQSKRVEVRGDWENQLNFIPVTKENAIGGICGRYGKQQDNLQGSGQENWSKETTMKT